MLYGGQKFITIKEAIDNLLDLGDYGEDAVDYVNGASYIDDALQEAADGMVDIYYHDLLHWLPDNYEWLEEADAQGLLEGCKGDLMKMTQAAQYECYSQNLYDHKADILAATVLDHLKDQGVYAISEDMADTLIEGIRDASDGMNRFSDATDLAEETMSDSLTEALGDEDGELSADMADTLRDSGYDKPNPCMMSAEAVRWRTKTGTIRHSRTHGTTCSPNTPKSGAIPSPMRQRKAATPPPGSHKTTAMTPPPMRTRGRNSDNGGQGHGPARPPV